MELKPKYVSYQAYWNSYAFEKDNYFRILACFEIQKLQWMPSGNSKSMEYLN